MLANEVGSGNVFARKREGVVAVDFEPMASIEVPDAKTVRLGWNSPIAEKWKIDKEKVQKAFELASAGRSVQWSYS